MVEERAKEWRVEEEQEKTQIHAVQSVGMARVKDKKESKCVLGCYIVFARTTLSVADTEEMLAEK